MRKNRLLLLLALLMTAATGAWAQTPLVTIESKDYTSFKSGNMTFDDKVTVTFSNSVRNDGNNNGWYATNPASLLTVAGINGYTITSCKFYTDMGTASTGYTVEGESPSVYLYNAKVYTDANQSENIGFYGIKKIEVYGAAASSGYTVSLKDGVKDADKWTLKVGDGQAQALPIGGLKGDGSETVTLQYTGRLKVKGVKATSEAAEASVPDGAINGKFSVSDGKQVYFSKGNLRYASSKWSFFDNQYDYYTSYSADAWDKFGWSTSATTYGMNTSADPSTYSGDFVDWGNNSALQTALGTGWFTLSSDEWTYLFNTRTVNGGTGDGKSYTKGQSVNGKLGLVIYPDNYTGDVYSGSDWATFESAGCVFLPAAGYRSESTVDYKGTRGFYWSATLKNTSNAYRVRFLSGNLYPADSNTRYFGHSVRLVREVATSEAAPAVKPAATVTTAPTGAAVVGVGKTTALVSGGAADGGTLWYAVTTTNTKPTSTAGFSDAVPTAKDITASGKVYVWYYVKGDDSHSDSEIAGPVSVTLAEVITWNSTNISDLRVRGTFYPYTMEGITLSGNSNDNEARWRDRGDESGINFEAMGSGGYTFTAPTGKKFTKIEMTLNGPIGWEDASLGTGWAFDVDYMNQICKVTWTGNAASTVGLLTGASSFYASEPVNSIVFYLSE